MYVTIENARQHLNILEGEAEFENDYILHLIQSAEDAVAKRLNVKSLSELVDPYTGGLPDSVIHTILLLIGDWYSARETFAFQNVGKLPNSFDFLADLNKSYNTVF